MVNSENIEKIVNRLSMLIPNLEIPKDEDSWAFLTNMYKDLNLNVVSKVLENLKDDEYAELKKAPYVYLKKLVISKTEYDKEQKEAYRNSQEIDWYVDDFKGIMQAYTKNGIRREDLDREMNAIEEDYYLYNLMSKEEYDYYSGKTEKVPDNKLYDKYTRTNKLSSSNDLERIARIKLDVDKKRHPEKY